MRTRRLAGAGLTTTMLALALTGCTDAATGTASPGPAVSSAPANSGPADPAATAALGRAAAALGSTSFRVSVTSGPGVKLTAGVDAPNGRGTGTLAITGTNTDITVRTLLIDQDLYVQVPGVTRADTWTRVDVDRLPAGAQIGLRPGQIDPANTAQLLAATTDVQQADARSYRGTLDLTRVAGVAGIDGATVQGLGDQAQRVPFTAGLDEQGRLSALTVQLPAVDGRAAPPAEVLYTGYGEPVDAQRPPAGQITEAPDSLYRSLGG